MHQYSVCYYVCTRIFNACKSYFKSPRSRLLFRYIRGLDSEFSWVLILTRYLPSSCFFARRLSQKICPAVSRTRREPTSCARRGRETKPGRTVRSHHQCRIAIHLPILHLFRWGHNPSPCFSERRCWNGNPFVVCFGGSECPSGRYQYQSGGNCGDFDHNEVSKCQGHLDKDGHWG